jgi:hypothetical protein
MVWLRVVAAVVACVALIAIVTGLSSPRQAAQTKRATVSQAAAGRNDRAVLRERARLKAEQRPHFGRAPQRQPSRAAQAAITAALERSITADAQARYRRHQLDHAVGSTACEYLPGNGGASPALTAARAGYDCTAITVRVRAVPGQVPAEIIGFPFLARVNFRTGRYVWCKVSRRPAEHGTGVELAFVPVPKVCDVYPPRA